MAITIPLTGEFNLTYKLRRVGTAGEAIAGVSFTNDTWHDLIWLRLINPVVGTTYTLNLIGLTLDDIKDVNPTITTAGAYDGRGSAWNSYSGSPTIWTSGTFGDGTQYVVYRAKTGLLENRQNIIDKAKELIVISVAGGSELVDWYLTV